MAADTAADAKRSTWSYPIPTQIESPAQASGAFAFCQKACPEPVERERGEANLNPFVIPTGDGAPATA